MYLITKWFGTFLCDRNKIKAKILFPKKEKEIEKRLEKIKNYKVLSEEKKILVGVKKNIIVNEKRLDRFGNYDPTNPFFKKIDIKPEDYEFPRDLFKKSVLSLSRKQTEKNLESDDLQVIQMINTFDDFIQILNLLYERYNAWSEIRYSKKRILSIKRSISTIEDEMDKIEKQIEEDMEKIAPNTTDIISPLIGARLISKAGGLKKLALLPASTIQILGAEKALFRYKKEGGKPPKHGVIFQHKMIKNAPRNKRGKIARAIANKISIAINADVFSKRKISDDLKKDLNKKISEIRNL